MIRTAGNDPGQRGWEATVDYYIRLPRSCNVAITTVNSPLIQTIDLTGNLQITNFSGVIDITATGAPMAVDTTNGDIVVRLKGTPRSDSRLRTLNGSVRLFAQARSRIYMDRRVRQRKSSCKPRDDHRRDTSGLEQKSMGGGHSTVARTRSSPPA